jgi:hypothetical protein
LAAVRLEWRCAIVLEELVCHLEHAFWVLLVVLVHRGTIHVYGNVILNYSALRCGATCTLILIGEAIALHTVYTILPGDFPWFVSVRPIVKTRIHLVSHASLLSKIVIGKARSLLTAIGTEYLLFHSLLLAETLPLGDEAAF